jgi:hypothetical protein
MAQQDITGETGEQGAKEAQEVKQRQDLARAVVEIERNLCSAIREQGANPYKSCIVFARSNKTERLWLTSGDDDIWYFTLDRLKDGLKFSAVIVFDWSFASYSAHTVDDAEFEKLSANLTGKLYGAVKKEPERAGAAAGFI